MTENEKVEDKYQYAEQTIVYWIVELCQLSRYDLIEEAIENYLKLDSQDEKLTWVIYHYTCKVKHKIKNRDKLKALVKDPCDFKACSESGTPLNCISLNVLLHKIKYGVHLCE